jgi:hypothetical protein
MRPWRALALKKLADVNEGVIGNACPFISKDYGAHHLLGDTKECRDVGLKVAKRG